MVTRKPVPSAKTIPAQGSSSLPYPTSPSSPKRGRDYPAASMYETAEEDPWREREETSSQARPRIPNVPSMSELSDHWVDAGQHEMENSSGSQPPSARDWPTNADTTQSFNTLEIPSLLRAGPSESTPRSSSESQQSLESLDNDVQYKTATNYSTNPYHRARTSESQDPDVSRSQEQSSVDIWADLTAIPPIPTSAPPPPPVQVPLDAFNHLSLSNDLRYEEPRASGFHENHSSSNYTNSSAPMTAEQYGAEVATQASPFAEYTNAQSNIFADHAGWSDQVGNSRLNVRRIDSNPFETDSLSPQEPNPPPSSYKNDLPSLPPRPTEEAPPELPPRRSHEEDVPDIQQPWPLPDEPLPHQLHNGPPRSDTDTPQTRAKNQRSETYQIKHIRWLDSSSGSTRVSPIMVQNANGPCPLLALVNALTLSTPATSTTALVETLRVREQVSLGLLLDAVFDELMSGRRGDAAQELPDVADLYSFLVTLHTGMNVNPRFVNLQEPNLIDGLSPMYGNRVPGGFENTKEMKLYSTFSVPLIHGWLPPRSHPAYAALERSARTYEDAQNLMFREEELEDKLQHEGLSHEEQVLLEDIASIKYFLSSSATQLTAYGLDTITEALLPGSIAILFRNDHFSTLYKHPRSEQLFTLVTDMGYAGHEEVVWEGLVDVNGEGSSFFAGDFRPVGDTAPSRQDSTQNNSDWTTVSHSRRSTTNNPRTTRDSNPQHLPTPPSESYNLPSSPTTEQEDHDLALALQLQEEEDERSRSSQARRNEEAVFARTYLDPALPPTPVRRSANSSRSTQSQVVRPLVPPRGGSASANATRRPPSQREAVRRDPEAADDAPPPSYEQAAKSRPYIPPPAADQASYGESPSSGGPQGRRARGQSAYSQHAGMMGTGPSVHRVDSAGTVGGFDGAGGLPIPRRRSVAYLDEESRQRDCAIM